MENGQCYGYICASVSTICLLGFATVFTVLSSSVYLNFKYSANNYPSLSSDITECVLETLYMKTLTLTYSLPKFKKK